jgi:hypothetical protein
MTRGDRREHRPDLHHVMRAWMVEPHAGMPVRMPPLRGKSRDAPACGPVVRAPMAPWHTTDGAPSLVAERALDREDHRPQRSATRLNWGPRVPAPWSDAPAARAQADPPTMAPRLDGDRERVVTSTSGGVAQRWVLIASERLPQVQRPVDTHRCKHTEPDVNACNNLCRTALACAADAPQALSTFAHG